jgi:SAM-dependent methyltransferase
MIKRFAAYDSRGCRTLDVLEGYSAWASFYDDTTDDRLDIALLGLLTTVDWSDATRAVDLACGTGRIGYWLRAHGVGHVDGIDISRAMLDQAALKAVYDSLSCADAAFTGLGGAGYNLVVSSLATCHVDKLLPFYTEAVRLLQPGGRVVLVDYHPFMLLKGVPTHFDTPAGEPTAIRNVIHLFSDHVRAARGAGLELIELQEQIVGLDWIAENPRMARHAGHPISFVMVWTSG